MGDSYFRKAALHDVLRPARDDQLLRHRAERGERELASTEANDGGCVVDLGVAQDRGLFLRRRASFAPEVLHQRWALEADEPVVERVALVRLAEAGGDNARDARVLERRRRLLARRAGA